MLNTIFVVTLLVLAIGMKCMAHYYKLKMQYRKYLFEPVELKNKYPETAAYFAQRSAEIERLGFENLGDFVLSHWPRLHLTRCLAGPLPWVFADVDEYKGTRSATFLSVFSDGTVLESSCAGLFDGQKVRYREESVYKVNHMPDAAIPDLYAAHLDVCREYCEQHDCQMLAFERGVFRSVSEHIHRMAYWNLHQKGIIPEPPSGTPVSVTAEPVAVSQG